MSLYENIKKLVRNEGLWVNEPLKPIKIENPKSFLIYSPVPWEPGNFERMISVALRLRGHDVDEFICGGNFSACGMEHVDVKRPSCANCIKNAIKWMNLWKLPYLTTSDYITADDIKIAQQETKKVNLDNFLNLTFKEMCQVYYKDYPIGKRIYEHISWYFTEDLSDKEKVYEYIDKVSYSYILAVHLAERLLDKKDYSAVVVCNTKKVESSPITDVCLNRDIRLINWEELGTENLIFDNNSPATDFLQPGIWEQVKDEELSDKQREVIENHFEDNKKNNRYYSDPIENREKIFKDLNLRKDSYKIVLFSNIISDAVVIGIHTMFNSIPDMIRYLCKYAEKNPDIELIIRAHPYEKVFEHYTKPKVIVGDVVREMFDNIPENIHIIEGKSQISSYTLMDIADVNVSYTNTLSLEAPIYGKQMVVVSQSHNRNKGFTYDIETKDELKDIFDRRFTIPKATEEQREIVLKYAYFHFYRLRLTMDFYKDKKFIIKTLKMFVPGEHIFWDNFCDSIVNDYAFVDILNPDRKGYKVNKHSEMRKKVNIKLSDVELFPTADPDGELFYYKNKLYRGIFAILSSERINFFKKLVRMNDKLSKLGVVSTKESDLANEKYALILEHEIISPITYPLEWNFSSLVSALIFYAKLNIELYHEGIGFKDAHNYNVAFDYNLKPYFVDYTSLCEIDDKYTIPKEFNRYFLNIIYYILVDKAREGRRLIDMQGYKTGSKRGGIDDIEVLEILKDKPEMLAYYNKYRNKEEELRSKNDIIGLFKLYIEELENNKFSLKDTMWSTYYDVSGKYPSNIRYDNFEPNEKWEPKQKFIHKALQNDYFKTLLDVGCSAGWFSILAARLGKKVISMDFDESAIEKLYQEVINEKELQIAPIYGNFSDLDEIYKINKRNLSKRVNSDVVFALALIHHLIFIERMSWKEVIDIFASFTNKLLIFEFLRDDDPSIIKFREQNNCDYYTFDNLFIELQKHFSVILRTDSAGNYKRNLLFCYKTEDDYLNSKEFANQDGVEMLYYSSKEEPEEYKTTNPLYQKIEAKDYKTAADINYYLKANSYFQKETINPAYPAVWELETTNICAMKCVQCPRQYLMKRGLKHMDIDLFKKITNQMRPFAQNFFPNNYPMFQFIHYGEPSLYKYYKESIEYAKKKGFYVVISSTAPAIPEPRLKEIIDSQLDELWLIFDGMDDETFSSIRGKSATFTKGIENLNKLLELKKQSGNDKPSLKVFMIKQQLNRHQWKEFDEYFSKVDGVYHQLGHFSTFGNRVEKIRNLQKEIMNDPDEIKEQERVKKLNSEMCFYPWHSLSVMADGRVVPCCRDVNGDYVLGDLKTQTLEEIWNGEKMKKLRQDFINGNYKNPLCHMCKEKSLEIGLPKKDQKFINGMKELDRLLSETKNVDKYQPLSRKFGFDRGTPIDRFYMELFLSENRNAIRGNTLEISEATYSKKYGTNVTKADVLHAVEGNSRATIVGNLETGENIPKNRFDCIILTQTIHVIYDYKAVIENCYNALKENGVLLITTPGISQISRYDMDRWGDYWRFTNLSLKRVLAEKFNDENVVVKNYGNYYLTKEFLNGRALEEIDKDALNYVDNDYQLLLTAKAQKKSSDESSNSEILVYHRIGNDPIDSQLLAVSPENFERQIIHLKNEYNIVPLDKMVDDISKNLLEPKTIAITFDDGYLDNLTNALPIIEKYQIPVTIFIATNHIGSDKEFWWDELENLLLTGKKLPDFLSISDDTFGDKSWGLNTSRDRFRAWLDLGLILRKQHNDEINSFLDALYESWANIPRVQRPTHRRMNLEQLKLIASSPYINIGSHSITHSMMSQLSDEDQAKEVLYSSYELEKILGKKPTLFAYPYGNTNDFNKASEIIVEQAGYKAGISNIQGSVSNSSNVYSLNRRLVRNWDIDTFKKWLKDSDKKKYEQKALELRDSKLNR